MLRGGSCCCCCLQKRTTRLERHVIYILSPRRHSGLVARLKRHGWTLHVGSRSMLRRLLDLRRCLEVYLHRNEIWPIWSSQSHCAFRSPPTALSNTVNKRSLRLPSSCCLHPKYTNGRRFVSRYRKAHDFSQRTQGQHCLTAFLKE